ncbi:MAG TPA: hypothetical protein VMT61_15220 [Candidatus Binataceae bacterium]|nr:hypothetical protein [Candidatus Binataceae bacterium]
MNKGKVIEETALKCATIAVSPGPGGSTMLTGNYEGSAPGLGKTVVTASFAGRHSGTFIAHGYSFGEDGETVSGTATGQYEKTGTNHWRTNGILERSTGETPIIEGEMDLATRTWTVRHCEKA